MAFRMAEVAERDRPRERLARVGAGSLTDAELVALILRSGGRDRSALHVAHELLAKHGGIGGLADVDLVELAREPTMGNAKATSLLAALELGRRAAAAPAGDRVCVRDAADIAALARRELADVTREQVVVVVLNMRHQLIDVQRLTVGTDTRCLVEPRDVLRVVLARGGAAFALAHNHPTGTLEPSAQDVQATVELRAAAKLVGVTFLDHIVIAGTRWTSIFGGT